MQVHRVTRDVEEYVVLEVEKRGGMLGKGKTLL